MSDSIGTCPSCAAEWQRDLRDYADGFAAGQRGPVVPIPVSEPPGDNDIVLPLWKAKDQDDPLFWTWFQPMRGMAMGMRNQHTATMSMTHYLLLRKGE